MAGAGAMAGIWRMNGKAIGMRGTDGVVVPTFLLVFEDDLGPARVEWGTGTEGTEDSDVLEGLRHGTSRPRLFAYLHPTRQVRVVGADAAVEVGGERLLDATRCPELPVDLAPVLRRRVLAELRTLKAIQDLVHEAPTT